MLHTKIKQFVLLLGFILPATWCSAFSTETTDGVSHIMIIESQVQGVPKTSSIQATIDGHSLSIVFLENLGQVTIQITTADGEEVQTTSFFTPSGTGYYIPDTGRYIVTFILPNGDVYYGEFEVTD